MEEYQKKVEYADKWGPERKGTYACESTCKNKSNEK